MADQHGDAVTDRTGPVSEHDVIEVLAYLVTAARTQVDESAEYAPMRLMTAAQKLAELLAPDGPGPRGALFEALDALPLIATPTADRAEYVDRLDTVCVRVAELLLEQPEPRRAP